LNHNYSLGNNNSVHAKIRATNLVGSSAYSASGNGAILTHKVPGPPGTPTITLSGSNIEITWTASSFDGGEPITRYIVSVKKFDGAGEIVNNCEPLSTTCTVAVSLLEAAPYNLGG